MTTTELKYIKSLHLKKFRQKYHNFVVEGDKIAREVLLSNSFEVEGIYAEQNWINANADLLKVYSDKVTEITAKELGRISLLRTPNQVFLVLKQATTKIQWSELEKDYALYLDDVQDPGNVGTILRIADWFGIGYVFYSEKSADFYNPKVIQSTMGAFLRVKGIKMELDNILENQADLPMMGAVVDGENIFKQALPKNGLIIIGNESKGISKTTLKRLNYRISIPKHQNGGAESLNAAVATGIICAQLRNQ